MTQTYVSFSFLDDLGGTNPADVDTWLQVNCSECFIIAQIQMLVDLF